MALVSLILMELGGAHVLRLPQTVVGLYPVSEHNEQNILSDKAAAHYWVHY